MAQGGVLARYGRAKNVRGSSYIGGRRLPTSDTDTFCFDSCCHPCYTYQRKFQRQHSLVRSLGSLVCSDGVPDFRHQICVLGLVSHGWWIHVPYRAWAIKKGRQLSKNGHTVCRCTDEHGYGRSSATSSDRTTGVRDPRGCLSLVSYFGSVPAVSSADIWYMFIETTVVFCSSVSIEHASQCITFVDSTVLRTCSLQSQTSAFWYTVRLRIRKICLSWSEFRLYVDGGSEEGDSYRFECLERVRLVNLNRCYSRIY